MAAVIKLGWKRGMWLHPGEVWIKDMHRDEWRGDEGHEGPSHCIYGVDEIGVIIHCMHI